MAANLGPITDNAILADNTEVFHHNIITDHGVVLDNTHIAEFGISSDLDIFTYDGVMPEDGPFAYSGRCWYFSRHSGCLEPSNVGDIQCSILELTSRPRGIGSDQFASFTSNSNVL